MKLIVHLFRRISKSFSVKHVCFSGVLLRCFSVIIVSATAGCESSKPERWLRNRPSCHTDAINSRRTHLSVSIGKNSVLPEKGGPFAGGAGRAGAPVGRRAPGRGPCQGRGPAGHDRGQGRVRAVPGRAAPAGREGRVR